MRSQVVTSVVGVLGSLACLSAISVEAAGPPAVQVQVTNSVLPVQLTNSQPIQVTTVTSPLELYADRHPVAFSGGASVGSVNFDVPDGKRLVIEAVSLLAQLPAGQSAWFAIEDKGTPNLIHPLSVQPQGTFFVSNGGQNIPKSVYVGTHSLTLRVAGGAGDGEIAIRYNTSGSPNGSDGADNFVSATITGYLEDL